MQTVVIQLLQNGYIQYLCCIPTLIRLKLQFTCRSQTKSMQSATSRLNNIIMFGATVLLAMSIINHIHGRFFIYDPQPDIEFNITEVTQFRNTTLWEQLSFKYDLKANLTTLYTWNLKQLFVYIQITWTNQDNFSNRMIVSDWIVESPIDRSKIKDKFYIEAKNKQIQYTVRDVHRKLKGKTLDVTINAEYMPTVGFFFKTELFRTTLKVPDAYV